MEGHSGIRSEGSQQLFNRNYAGHVYTCGGGAYGLMGKYKKRMDTYMVITVISTFGVMAAAGKAVQLIMNWEKKNRKEGK